MDNFGLFELAEALRERVEADQKLLSQVHRILAEGHSNQPLNALDDLIPLDHIETATHGKIRVQQARWLARNRETNGMKDAFTTVGKRLFVNLPIFTAALLRGGV